MVISSRTPEGEANRCTVCGSEVKVEPSDPTGDAPCSRCGHLLWFKWEDLGDVDIIRPTESVLTRDALLAFLDSVAMKPGNHLILDLAEVDYLASAALGLMINMKRRVNAVGGRFSIRHIRPDLLEIFRITRLEHVFELEP